MFNSVVVDSFKRASLTLLLSSADLSVMGRETFILCPPSPAQSSFPPFLLESAEVLAPGYPSVVPSVFVVRACLSACLQQVPLTSVGLIWIGMFS